MHELKIGAVILAAFLIRLTERLVELHFSDVAKQKSRITIRFCSCYLKEGTPIRENFSNDEEFVKKIRIPVVLAFYL